jgi:4-hydroxybenzoate polyprenyltransferase
MRAIAGYLRMLRVEDWIFGYFFIPLIGTIAAAGLSPVLLVTAVISACTLAFGFVINNLADVEIDRLHTTKCDTNKNPLAADEVTLRGTWILCLLLAIVPLGLSLHSGVPAFVCVAVTLVLCAVYSVYPFRLKERYLLDLLTHGLMFGAMLFLIGYTLPGPGVLLLSAKAVSLSLLFTCIGCMALLVHQIGDYNQDHGHSATTVVQIGKKRGWILLLSFMALSFASLAAVNAIVMLEPWMLWGAVTLFVIPLFLLRNEIRSSAAFGILPWDSLSSAYGRLRMR